MRQTRCTGGAECLLRWWVLLVFCAGSTLACAAAETAYTGGPGPSGGSGGGGLATTGGTGGTGGTGPVVDADDDGWGSDVDCDDSDPDVNPGAVEICDGIDNDCDDEIDEADAQGASLWYEDKDGDNYGISGVTVTACDQPDGYAPVPGDCNDDDDRFYPGAPETDCEDPNDYNCDGSTGYTDADNDGFAACQECDDSNDQVYPGAPELCDGLDNDCNGLADAPGGEDDNDHDGSYSCEDCDDDDGDNFPGNPEICDGQDNDCNGQADAPGGEIDNDNDGSFSCADCNDNNPNNYPGNSEICDGEDNNCNGQADFPGELIDGDNDNSLSCVDCDDNDPNNFPGNAEACDGEDNNCNGQADAPGGEIDFDNDGSLSCVDCDDNDPDNYPGNLEICDGEDNNCNFFIDQTEVPVNVLCPPVPLAVEDCAGAQGCVIVSCSNDYHDANGIYADGCECQANPLPSSAGALCTTPISIGTLHDSGDTVAVSGNTPFAGRSVWYAFTATDDPDTAGDEYHVDGRFTLNPGNVYRMEIWRGGCPGSGTSIGNNEDCCFDWYTDFNRTNIGCTLYAPCGEGDCTDPETIGGCVCDDDTSTYYVRVYHSAAQPACDDFIIEFSNGIY